MIQTLRKQRTADLYEFEDSLVYRLSYRSAYIVRFPIK